MPDITNYAYVWYARDPSQQITQEDLDKIYEIILNYSYPCYLSGSALIRALTPEEKTKLLQHELSFIEEKMETAGLSHIVMMQIPRVLYDLFNLYFTFMYRQKFTDLSLSSIPTFDYACYLELHKMNDYDVITRRYTDSVKDNIFALNAFIGLALTGAFGFSSNVENVQKKEYDEIADELVGECFEFKMFQGMSVEEAKKIVRQVIHFEKQDSQGRAILYRGSENIVDSLIDLEENYYSNPPLCDKYMQGVISDDPCMSLSFRSLSFNTSIFTGCVMDPGACTMGFFSKTTYRGDLNDKIKLSIKKFLFDDLSVENSLFFIPPIHPYVQLYSTGELFHPRTKIGSDYIELKKKLSDTKPSASSRFTPDFVKGLWGCGPNEATFIQGCDYLKSTETQEQLNALYQRYKSTKVVGTWSSDAATQSKQERFMEARAETVKAAAAKAAELPRPARPEVDKLLDKWRNFEAIPGETKFEKIKSYYPQLVKRFRFMLSDFMSEYLYSLCPQASVKVSFEEMARGYRSNVVYPSATFEFQSKGDFEECQRKLPMLTLTVDKKGLKSTLHSGEKVEKLFRSAGTNLRNAEAIFLYNQQYEEERLNSARSPLDQKSARLARSSPFTELYRKYEQTDNIRNKVEWISFFLDQYQNSWESKRRDDDTEYKNQLDEYFKFMIDIFHFKFMNIFPTPPFTPPTRPVPVPEMPVAPVGPVPEMPLAPVGPVPEKRSGIEKKRQAFVRQAFKETANDDDKFGGGKKRTIRKKNRKGTRTTIRKRQRKNRTRTMRKKTRKSRNSRKSNKAR